MPNPVATCELQAWWYAGLEWMAAVFFLAGDYRYALSLARKTLNLKCRFDAAFWMEDLGFYALALDPQKRQVRSIASNAVHLLATGIVPPDKGCRVARRAMQPDMFSGWGIRTLSHDHPVYNPFGYHLGTVWPVESAAFAFGFARYGCVEELHRLAEATFAASELFAESRLPEAIGGIPRDERHPHPGVYPNTSEPQGWSASSTVLIIQALLGMRAIAPLRLLLIDPHLPSWLPDLRLEGIRVGRARVDLEFHRSRSGKTQYRVTGSEGPIFVLRQPVPQGSEATLAGRISAALASFFLIRWP